MKKLFTLVLILLTTIISAQKFGKICYTDENGVTTCYGLGGNIYIGDGTPFTDDFLDGGILTDGQTMTANDFESSRKLFYIVGDTVEVTLPDLDVANKKIHFWAFNGRINVKVADGVAGISGSSKNNNSPFTFMQSVVDSIGYRSINTNPYQSYLPHPNAANPNPELITGDAIAFINETGSINEATLHNPVNATIELDDSGNPWGQYSARIIATNTTFGRDRVDKSGLIDGEIYEVVFAVKHDNNTGTARYRVTIGSNPDLTVDRSPSTTWTVVPKFEFTYTSAEDTYARIENYIKTSTTVGEGMNYKMSLKLKND